MRIRLTGPDTLAVHAEDAARVFKGRHFEPEIIILWVRRYFWFSLGYRDLEELMAERNLSVDHVTISALGSALRSGIRETMAAISAAGGGSWRCDETCIRVKGKWAYLYRAVDKAGQTVDFYLSEKRDVNAAKAFLRQEMKRNRVPTKITLDAYTHRTGRFEN